MVNCRRLCPGLGFLPITLVVLSCATIITTYIIAIAKNDVVAFLPYISDTGTTPPESCVFAQFLNLAAMLSFCTMYVRYRHVSALTGNEGRRVRCLNKASIVLAVFTSIGLMLVANFQETNAEIVHLIGAGFVFGLGVIYELIQVILSFEMCPVYNGRYICNVRVTIWTISVIAMIITFITAFISRSKWDQTSHATDKRHWTQQQNGYTEHVISSFGEWIMATSFLLFFFTFVRDFQKLTLAIEPRLFVQHLDDVVVEVYPDETTRLLI